MTFFKSLLSIVSALHDGYELTFFYFLLCVMHRKETRSNRSLNMKACVFATGCFWGTEKMFWRLPGVYSTSVGYVGGYTKNPTYEEVCSGATGHTEAVQVAYDPTVISSADLLAMYFTNHDPTPRHETRQRRRDAI